MKKCSHHTSSRKCKLLLWASTQSLAPKPDHYASTHLSGAAPKEMLETETHPSSHMTLVQLMLGFSISWAAIFGLLATSLNQKPGSQVNPLILDKLITKVSDWPVIISPKQRFLTYGAWLPSWSSWNWVQWINELIKLNTELCVCVCVRRCVLKASSKKCHWVHQILKVVYDPRKIENDYRLRKQTDGYQRGKVGGKDILGVWD